MFVFYFMHVFCFFYFVFWFKVEAYRTDPLIWHGAGKLGCFIAFVHATDKTKQLIPSIQWPFLVVHGEEDKLSYIGGTQLLAKDAKSQDKEIKVCYRLKDLRLSQNFMHHFNSLIFICKTNIVSKKISFGRKIVST